VDRTNVEKLSLQKEIEAMLPNTARDGVGFEPIAVEEIIDKAEMGRCQSI